MHRHHALRNISHGAVEKEFLREDLKTHRAASRTLLQLNIFA